MRPVAPLLALLLGLCGPLAWAAPTATSPVVPEAVQGVALSAVSDPEAASGSLRMALAPGGQMLAASNGAAAWLYLREARRRFAVTPVGGRRDRHDMGAVASIEGLRWGLDGRLYVWARLFNGAEQIYAADRGGALGPVLRVPERWPDEDDALADRYPVPDPDNAYDIHATARHIVWRQNLGHGSMALMAAEPGGAPRQLARGGWELEDALFDAAASHVIYASAEGVVVQGLAPGAPPGMIAGTRGADQPLSFDAASRWLALRRARGGCDAAVANPSGEHVCLLRLPPAGK